MALTKRLVSSPIKSPSSLRRFSAFDVSYREDIKKQTHKALTIVNLVIPETGFSSANKSRHNRLIEDILQTPDTTSSIRCDSERSSIDAADLSLALSLCSSARDLRAGIRYHCAAIRSGFVANVYVGTSLVGLYGKCNELSNALQMFDEMPVRNVVTWTAVISGFAREWRVGFCLDLFYQMRISDLRPNRFTFTSLLSACSGTGALENGRSVHSLTIRSGFHSYVFVSNALMSMYCKCGALGDAHCVFAGLDGKDIVSWNSMIAGYAQHGLALQAIDLFEEMMRQSVKPDSITFLSVLSSCRHTGLVKKGRVYLNLMIEHGVEPELDHFSCVVDLLGRAGLLEEARDIIEKMPIAPNAIIWGAMLSSSRLHGNLWFGIEAAESRLALEPSCAATYLQLANLYAGVGRYDRAASVRKLMKDKGLKTIPGYSWIEIKNVVHKFSVEDKSNTKMVDIVSVLDSLLDHITTLDCDAKLQDLSYTII